MASVKSDCKQKNYYILLEDLSAYKKADLSFLTKGKSVSVFKGSLWFARMNYADGEPVTLQSVDDTSFSLDCSSKCVSSLTYTEFQLLRTISHNKDRYSLHSNEYDKLRMAVNLYDLFRMGKAGKVKVKISCENAHRYINGFLVNIGCIRGSPGYFLKIIYDYSKGKNSEIYVKLDQIKEFIRETTRTHQQMLKVGDRVVWISDRDVAEYGTVKWCGTLNEYRDQCTYGVEFDNPVGTGTGQYQGEQLFETRMNHASFIPALGLIEAEEFDSTPTISENKTQPLKLENMPSSSLSKDVSLLSKRLTSINSTKIEIEPSKIDTLSSCSSKDARIEISQKSRCTSSCPCSMNGCKVKADPEIGVGSMVQVDIPGMSKLQFGVVRWKGKVYNEEILGIELEEACSAATNGCFDNEQKFVCDPKKGYFAKLSKIKQDSRFNEFNYSGQGFGSIDCPDIVEPQKCLFVSSELELLKLLKRNMDKQLASKSLFTRVDQDMEIGRNLGIQGHHNSCYMDVTLFSMFAFNYCFDSLLYRTKSEKDVLLYNEIQLVLRNEIVNPLRSNVFVRADRMMKLRRLINTESVIQGFLTDEKDPEEFLHCMFEETLKTEPFIKFSSGSTEYSFQLIVNGAGDSTTTQDLLRSTLLRLNLTFSESPSCLILQLPRCGKEKVFHSILPSLFLNIGNVKKPALCFVCGGRSSYQCNDCCQESLSEGKSLDFCRNCSKKFHSNLQRKSHQPFFIGEHEASIEPLIQNEVMELFAVICIKTSHYVCFNKCGLQPDSPWVFFDSMSDRIGLDGGYNVPKMTPCDHIPKYLYDPQEFQLLNLKAIEKLPDEVKRFMCDGYVCMYRNPYFMNYR